MAIYFMYVYGGVTVNVLLYVKELSLSWYTPHANVQECQINEGGTLSETYWSSSMNVRRPDNMLVVESISSGMYAT